VNDTQHLADNTSAIKLAKNNKFHDLKNHINTKYHLIRHHVETKTIQLIQCSISEKIANIFTKVFGRENFENIKNMLGLTNTPSD
jgi:hypothetical protein